MTWRTIKEYVLITQYTLESHKTGLTFKEQFKKTEMKIHTRNNLLRTLTIKNTKHVDTILNETCRVITGCLKPTHK